jgi:A/G-specific adenine glycosylase
MPSPDTLGRGEKVKLTRLAADLITWASVSGRAFPWRSKKASVYEKVAVEVLLQRTTATAVARFYDDFFSAYPGWGRLAVAEVEDLEQFLKPLGLWRRRASALIGLARFADERGGLFPASAEAHGPIPAVGQYVSNAILMFQHRQAAPLLDVNMARVLERFVRPRRLADIRYDPWLQEASRWFVRGNQPELKNWAILDFAALVCKARSPACPTCPVNRRCTYFLNSQSRVQSSSRS